MTYEEKEDSREVILVGYYNVLFYLIFRVGLDEYKKDILIERIRSGERMVMKDIYRWCEGHQIPRHDSRKAGVGLAEVGIPVSQEADIQIRLLLL